MPSDTCPHQRTIGRTCALCREELRRVIEAARKAIANLLDEPADTIADAAGNLTITEITD